MNIPINTVQGCTLSKVQQVIFCLMYIKLLLPIFSAEKLKEEIKKITQLLERVSIATYDYPFPLSHAEVYLLMLTGERGATYTIKVIGPLLPCAASSVLALPQPRWTSSVPLKHPENAV